VALDWFSRRVLSWRLSITMEAAFCIQTLEDALPRYGKPEIFNTDQGSLFTGQTFTGAIAGNCIAISMDGKGAWRDNVFVERFWRLPRLSTTRLRISRDGLLARAWPPALKNHLCSRRRGASQIFVGTMDTYPGTYQEEGVCKFVGKIEFVINAGAECSFATRNNSVIRGTNTVSKTFTHNDAMEVAMRTYILAIATAAPFAIPTAAFSESGHHRYYNRYEGLYDRYESARCRESRAACTHKEKLGEQVMGNCRRFRELCD
jgi:transposase InsO family protein